MEPRSVTEIIEHIQPLLRHYEKDDNLVVLDAEEAPGTKAGENYMSIVLRIKVTGRRGNGSPYKKSFMRKKLLLNSQFAKIARNDELFRIEAYFYEKLLPLLGPYGPDCILAQPTEIIMEDLGCREFSICEKRELQDLDHCLAVVQTLASMHASSLGLKLNTPEKFAELTSHLTENVFPSDEEKSLGGFMETSVKYALLSLESITQRTNKIDRAISFLQSYKDKVAASMKELLVSQPGEDRYWVITHGDTWNNNIMFLHDSEGKVVRVKLVDFQIVRHSSAALDFTYFVYSSVRQKVLEDNMDELVRTYENYFVHDLRKLDAPERDLEALAKPGWFKREIRKYGLMGFFGALMVLHAIFMDEGTAVEMEKNKTMENGEVNFEEAKPEEYMPLVPEKTDRILFIIDHYIRNFVDAE